MTAPDAILEAHLEHPDVAPRQRRFPVQGWVTSREPLRAVIVEGASPSPLALRLRPDVEKAMPGAPHCAGFLGGVGAEHLQDGGIHVRFVFDRGSTVRCFAMAPEPEEALELRHQKLARVYPALACLDCGSRFAEGGFSRGATSIRCPVCGAAYDCSQGCFDFLPAERRDSLAIGVDGNISQNHYDADALKLIHDGQDGLLLDCGAGLRLTEYTNVVNLEVVPYRSTDVLGDNERLPFADASFDGVLSLAVLEHVKNPFASAKELVRVLRPGGKLLAVVPLLAPVHAYPHHYYNMTTEGLVNLFRPDVDILETKVPESGLPIWALLWFLRSWSEGLTGPARDSFLKLRVEDLLGDAPDYLGRDFVTTLPRSKNFELASTTLLLGKKRG